MAQWERARLITARSLDQNQFFVYNHNIASVHQGTRATNRHGAEAARAAHNREVTRSKRVVGLHKGNLRFPFNPSLTL